MEQVQGWSEAGGTSVVVPGTQGSGSQRFQQSFRGCTVTVRDSSNNLATIYSDDLASPTAKANPFTSSSTTGLWSFYATTGSYSITFSGGAITAPFSITVNVGLGNAGGVPSYAFASLPTSKTQNAGNLARVTNTTRGLWMDTGTLWFSTSGRVVDVREFGATGDGSTSDQTAVAAAVTALASSGGSIFFPTGTYRLTAALTPGTNITFVGADRNSTILHWQATGTDGININTGCRVSHLTLRGPNSASPGNAGLDSGGASDIVVEDCIIEMWGDAGINTGGGGGARWIIVNNIVRQNVQQGIFLGQATNDSLIQGNEVYSNGSIGIDINGSRNLIDGNETRLNGQSSVEGTGILIASVSGNSNNNVVSNNVVSANISPGILITSTSPFTSNFNTIIGNNVSSQTGGDGDGITIGDGAATGTYRGNKIIGNIVNTNSRYGILVDATGATSLSLTTVENNTVLDNTNVGVFIGAGSLDTQLLNNVLIGNSATYTDNGTRTTIAGNKINATDAIYRILSSLTVNNNLQVANPSASAGDTEIASFFAGTKGSGGTLDVYCDSTGTTGRVILAPNDTGSGALLGIVFNRVNQGHSIALYGASGGVVNLGLTVNGNGTLTILGGVVSVGANDSGGAGFKLLRIPN